MKKYTYLIVWLLSLSLIAACSEDEIDMTPGNPVIELKTQLTSAHFGDHLPFTVNVSDNMPLSTVIARLYFGDEIVSTKTIRTKENGEYSDFIAIPFLKDIPDGKARLEFTLTDTHLSTAKKEVELAVSRPQFPYLILVTETESYSMLPTDVPNEYAVSASFPSTDLPAYIKAPAVGDNGNELVFGWDAGAVALGVRDNIPLSSPKGGKYTASFNTLTFTAAPFFEIYINGQKLTILDKENFSADIAFKQGDAVEFNITGVDLTEWWIDPDFFKKGTDGKYTFVPIDGKYRIIANTTLKYFRVQALGGDGKPATLQADGTGVIWVIGDLVGKPSLTNNNVSWNPDNALCMAPIGGKKYQFSVEAGKQVKTDEINFKFFSKLGSWDGEFGSTRISTASNLIFIGDGDNGRGDGNLGLKSGVTLENGASYVFTVDVSGGTDKAVLTVVKK